MDNLEIDILGALDAKVELNRETNETLEAMAQALFKSWFVDFDPIYARARGQAPAGMDAHTATLFPEDFRDSPVGRIPELWTVVSLEQLTSKIANAIFVEPNDILLDIAGPSILRTRIVDPQVSPAKVSSDVVVIRTKPAIPSCFIFLLLRDRGTQNHLLALATGETMQTAKTHVRSLRVLLPPQALLERFDELIAPILRRIENNNAQSRQITLLRDTLRPPHRSTLGGSE